MKKLHFSLMAILFALFSMVSFTACSSDDDDAPSQDDIKTNCIGMWQTTHISGKRFRVYTIVAFSFIRTFAP